MEKEKLLEMLNYSKKYKVTEKEAAKKFGFSIHTLSKWKRKYGIPLTKPGSTSSYINHRLFFINDRFFSKPTIQNSYYAGFIMADGNVSKDMKQLIICISNKDRCLLESFLIDSNSNYKINDGFSRGYPTSRINIYSKQICSDLKTNFNIVPQKTSIATPPLFKSKKHLDAFIMGLFDGDGTIGFNNRKDKQKTLYLSIVGTKEIVQLVKNRFEEILDKQTSNLFFRNSEKNFCSYRVSDKTARQIYIYFYEKYKNISKLKRKWTQEYYDFAISYKKALPKNTRKGVRIFNLNGDFISEFETLKEASNFTKVSIGRISSLCKLENKGMSKNYMFSRTKYKLQPYIYPKSLNNKYKNNNI